MKNLNLLYNKNYYVFVDKDGKISADNEHIKNVNNELVNYQFDSKDYLQSASNNINSFVLHTTYPGTLVGLGNLHSYSSTDAVKLGFTFDYVTGQPYIPGSTVKGIIRSAFKEKEIQQIFKKRIGISLSENDLIKMLFENVNVVFYDAVLSKDNAGAKILDFDYITPHKKKTKDPKPIQFLKIRPNIGIEFRFEFCSLPEGLSESTVLELFKEILLIVGVGAKASVGYGNLIEK